MTPRSAVFTALALTTLAVAPAAAQSRDNPVCDSNAAGLWKRDTRFLEIWWNEARPVDVAECLEAGADPDAVSILGHAAQWTRFPAVVQMLLEAGANPDPVGSGVASPLYWAVQRTDNVTVVYGVVAALLFANADMGPDRFGYTPLYHVLGNQPNSVALVELLLEAGADPNGSWGPVTPLHHAAQQTSNPQVLEALLAVGADPNAKTTLGTPLHIAIDRCRQMLVRTLLEHGADPNATRNLGQTPLEVAESCSNASGRDNIVRMLREAGATGPGTISSLPRVTRWGRRGVSGESTSICTLTTKQSLRHWKHNYEQEQDNERMDYVW